jgi:hypothetical protein
MRLPGFGNQHHHRVRERIAAHDQQLEGVVEGCGIGLTRIDQRPDLFQIGAKQRRRGALLARAHPVVIAAYGVDLAVVRDHAERVGKLPGRESVGRETLVNQSQRRDTARIQEVGVVLTHLSRQQQALVDDGPRRHRRLVELLAVLQPQRLNGVGGATANGVELALEGVGNHDVRATADEDLADHRFAGPHVGDIGRRGRPARRASRERPGPRCAPHARFLPDRQGAKPTLSAGRPSRRHSRRLAAAHALLGHFLAKEGVGNLNQDPGTVAHQRVGTNRAAVIQVLQDQQALLDDRVTFLAPDVRYKTDATGVVLVGWVVKPLPFRYGRIHHARILTKQRRMVPTRPLIRLICR